MMCKEFILLLSSYFKSYITVQSIKKLFQHIVFKLGEIHFKETKKEEKRITVYFGWRIVMQVVIS